MKLHVTPASVRGAGKLLVARIESRTWSLTAAAEAAGISERTAYRWLKRWREEGETGLLDRSSAPKSIPPARRPAALRRSPSCASSS